MKIVKNFPELFSAIQSNMSVFIHGQAATPITLVNELMKESERLKNVEIIHMHTEGNAPYVDPKYAQNFRVSNLFCGKNMRGKVDFNRIDYIPCFLSEIPALFRKGIKKINVAIVQVSPPDKHGYTSLGVSVDVSKAAVECADIVVAQINKYMPRLHGDGLLHMNDIDFAMELNEPIYSPKKGVISEI